MKKNVLTMLLLAGLLLAKSVDAETPANYLRAVRDAMTVESSEVVNNLDPLSPDNNTLVWNADKTMLKVVTWKSQASYERYILPYTQTSANEANVIWVTLAPKVQEFCKEFMLAHPRATQKTLEYRLKQRLGLHPDWNYDVFVEMWVAPEDVFRPCVDPGPADASCDQNFGNQIPVVKNIHDYKAFYEDLYYKSFRTTPGVPWTGLGYTYDWRYPRLRNEGQSEFILSPLTSYIIEQAIPTLDYCQP